MLTFSVLIEVMPEVAAVTHHLSEVLDRIGGTVATQEQIEDVNYVMPREFWERIAADHEFQAAAYSLRTAPCLKKVPPDVILVVGATLRENVVARGCPLELLPAVFGEHYSAVCA